MIKNPTLEVTKDLTENFKEIIKRFQHDQVLVGIPADSKERSDDSEMTNAAILAINEFGSPANNIKPWPVMKIGIKASQEDIAKAFKSAAQSALSKGFEALDIYYERAGIIASNSIKKVINAQVNVPEGRPTEGTLAARRSVGFNGKKVLLVTGQLRNAITYVVKGKAS